MFSSLNLQRFQAHATFRADLDAYAGGMESSAGHNTRHQHSAIRFVTPEPRHRSVAAFSADREASAWLIAS